MRQEAEIIIPTEDESLPGFLVLPQGAEMLVLFAHGSGSSRFSERNRFVAEVLQTGGLGTLLFDLLGETEALNRQNVFDIELLGARVGAALRWAMNDGRLRGMSLGLFGSSTGAAAALTAAAKNPGTVSAVVSRGGRPDLAGPFLSQVRAPTLLLVGGNDKLVLDLNRQAYALLTCAKELKVIPNASHLFEEPGTLEQAASEARDWFKRCAEADRFRDVASPS